MLGKLTAFEIRYHTRHVGFWITIAIMMLLGFLVMSTDVFTISANTGERIKANGAATIALQTSVFSLFSIFFGAVFVVSGVMRDSVYKALEMVHATPVSTRDMTLSRMAGVYVAIFLCISAGAVGLFAGQFAPWIDKETLGPVNVLYFLQPTLVFTAVNALLISALFTTVAAFTRNRALVYVSAVALFILYTASGLFVGEDAPDWLTALIDPFGSNALALTIQYWPADEQNTRMIPLWGLVGLNRLVWGGLALALYAVVFGAFKRGLSAIKTRHIMGDDDSAKGRVVLATATPEHGTAAALKALWRRFSFEYLTTVKSVPFIILSLLALVLFAVTLYAQMKVVPNPVLPISINMATLVVGSLLIPLLIIIVFFSGEMTWRDKTAGMTEILDASPVPNWPLLTGKWLALLAVVYTLLALGMVFAMIAQMLLGDIPVHVSTYLTFTFVSFAPRLVLYTVLVLFIQNFMPNRVIGMLAAGALVVFFFFFAAALPFSHPLMQFGNVSTGRYSEISGFANLINFTWFGLYWGSLGALFVILSIWLWRRGLQASLLQRLKTLGKRLQPASLAVALVFVAGFIGTGAYIFKAYNIDNDFRTRKQNELRRVQWEKLLGAHLKDPLPKIRSVKADVRFDPEARTATVKGEYRIENTTGKPLKRLYVTLPRRKKADNRSLTLQGAAPVTQGKDIKALADFATRVYRFDPPLAPGAQTVMRFETFVRAPSLGDNEPILRNGTFINNTVVMPQLGVVDRRLRNPDKRRKYKLPEYEKRPDRTDMKARQSNFFGASADYVDFAATVCTEKEQVPIAPGKLLRQYEKDGKTCRDYKSVRPIANFFSFLSARYTVRKDVWKNPHGADVPLAIYYHKSHGYNVETMIKAMKEALDTYTSIFGPYPYAQIRILEFPNAGFAQSFAGTIPFSENIGFVMDPGDPKDNKKLDLATYVVMHEIGHQWFGHQIMPANTKGFNVLSEGLTENAAMTAYERALGWQKARRVLEKRAIRPYLTQRAVDRKAEPPLARAEGQQYLDYNKASWVFWGLKQYIGKDRMQGAIRAFLRAYGYKGPPYPTTAQLVQHLRAAAGPKWQGLITDYWDRIVFWDLKFGDRIAVKPGKDGGYSVSLTVIVDKKIADEETGKETSVSKIKGETLNEWIEIGFYDHDPKKTLGDDWLKLERVHITKPETALTFTLDKRPSFVVLDPRRLLIERNVKDNEKALPKDRLASKN